jgi:hypothetical protein
MNEIIKSIRTIEEIQHVDQNLLSNQEFFEQLLLKFGQYEDFSPDQILEYANKSLKQDSSFIISTFLKLITLGYSKNHLYDNHQETVSYFYFNLVKPLLLDETISIKLIEAIGGSWRLNDSTFLADIKKNSESELEGPQEKKDENLKTFLIQEIFSDTQITSSDFFFKAIDALDWIVIKYLPKQFKNDESILAYAFKKNVKSKDFIPKSLLETSELIKSINEEKKQSKNNRLNEKDLCQLLLLDPIKFMDETNGMKFRLDLEKLQELPDNVAEALGKHNGAVNLNGIRSLSEKAANHLKHHKGILSLGGLSLLSEKASKDLMSHKGKINLFSSSNKLFYDFNELSVPLAQLIMKHMASDSLSFRYLKSISPEVVKIINKVSLRFHGFNTISDDVAEALGNSKGRSLDLNDIDFLSDKSVQFLSAFKGDRYLYLNKIKNLSLQSANFLSEYEGMFLGLSGLESVSIELVENLSKFKGVLILGGIQQISELEMEHFFMTIRNSRKDSGKTFKLELKKSLFETGAFELLIKNYSINLKTGNQGNVRLE